MFVCADNPNVKPCPNTMIPIDDLKFSIPMKSTSTDGVIANMPPADNPLTIVIAPFAKDHNISPNRVASLVSIVNACDFVGRLMNGVITDRKILKNHQSVIITLCVTTLCLALSPFYTQYWHTVSVSRYSLPITVTRDPL
jgi:hypothetical protein